MVASRPRVAVAGAGIGGLAAACALSRAGFPVDVYEQAPRLREVGVGLHLAANGARILRRWGLADRLREVAVRPAAMEVRGWGDDRVLFRQPMGGDWEAAFGAPYCTLHRADLHRMLAGQVPSGRVRLGRRLASVTARPDAVRLGFADGTSATADVLVGADGVHSVVRGTLVPAESPVFSGTSAYRGVVPAERLPGLPAESILLWTGPAARLLCYPISGGRLLSFVAVVPGTGRTRESWSSPGDPAELAAVFQGWNPVVRALVEAVGETHHWALYDREPLERWSAGRITLLGDAAHPMLPHHGQGASQALEDAVVLAHALDAAPGDVPGALRRYEAVRRPHTRLVQLGSRDGGSLRVRPDGPRQAARNVGEMVEDTSWIQRYDVELQLNDREARTCESSAPA
jgi:salicylate hydroxylase